MKTIIAERPSVACKIAHIVGMTKREEGCSKGDGYAITWAFGHLVQLAIPDDYGVRGFIRDNLPIIPDTLTLVSCQVRTGEGYRPDSGVVSQIKVIKRLFDTSEHVIVAADAGRERELILCYLYHYTGCATPFVHLWISSLTDRAIREGLRELEDGSKYDNLYLAAKTRSESDWLVGINGIQTLSIAAGHGTYSMRQMQIPTLAMVYECYWENRRFTSEAFWQLHIATDGCDGEIVKFSSSEKWREEEPAMELYNKVEAAGCATTTKARRKEKTEETPLLYDPATLQKEANTKHGFTAKQTLEIAQKLYERKLVTYPGTGSRCIPEDVFAEIPKPLTFIDTQPEWEDKVRAKAAPTRHGMDNGKVTDHHALLVTGEKPLFLSKEDNTIYQMIVRRTVETFSGKYVKDVTIVTAGCAGVELAVKDSVVRQTGWYAIYGEEKEEITIPDWQRGDTLTPEDSSITEGRTKPKPLHTGTTLLSAVETMGEEVEDDALRQAMKDCGIGTLVTRASTIEALFKHGYMERCKRSLVPVEKGLALNSVVKTMRIANVVMTDGQEKELARIERGELSDDTFHEEIGAYTHEVTSELISCDKLFGSRDSGCACPKCDTGRVRPYDKVVRCDNTEYGLPVFRLKAGHTSSDDEIKDLLTEGHTKLFKRFKSRQGKSFDTVVTFDREYNTTFVFSEAKKDKKFLGRKK